MFQHFLSPQQRLQEGVFILSKNMSEYFKTTHNKLFFNSNDCQQV